MINRKPCVQKADMPDFLLLIVRGNYSILKERFLHSRGQKHIC